MSSSLHRLGLWCANHGKRVLAIWFALLAALAAAVAAVGMNLDNTFEISNSESLDGLTILSERLPQAAGTSEQALFTSKSGDITIHQTTIEEFVDAAGDIDGISTVSDPFAESTNTISDNGASALVQIQSDSSVGSAVGAASEKANQVANQLDSLAAAAEASDSDLTVQLGGTIGQTVAIELSATEIIGVIIAAVVLLITFGSVMAAGAPIISALLGVGVGILGIVFVASFVSINSTTPVLAVMIGLAVGIDYALFIISRAREYLAEGIAPKEAAARAIATAGSAVAFAGTTVIVALCGLSVAGIAFLTSMGIASAAAVAVAVCVALTAVPAMLGLMGERIAPKERHGRKTGAMASRWVNAVTRFPAATILAVIAILGVCTIPISAVSLALTDNGFEPQGTQQRDTYDAISEAYGPGYNSPIIVIANIVQTDEPVSVVADLAGEIGTLDGVARVALETPNEDGSLAFIEILPEEGQADQATTDLVKTIRSNASDYEAQFGISDLMVTGRTAIAIDVANKLNSALLPFGTVVVGLSLVLLMVVFRSIAVPITATLGYLLSLGAGMGAVGAVWGWGWFADAINVTKTGAVISFLPVIVMGILFGLAMDYEVFLVSRMREEWIKTHDAKASVKAGFVGSAKVVSAAAIIMTSVFAAFIPDGMVYIKPIAVALTVGIAADAFLVRMTFIPAAMYWLGEKAWWLPGWLDRLLPVVDIEGEGLERNLEHTQWVAQNGPSTVRIENLVVSEGSDVAIDGLSLALASGELAVVRTDDVAARLSLAAVIGARLRATSGKVIIGRNCLPDGTASVQGMTTSLHNWDDEITDRAQVVVVDDPGGRRWKRVRQLLEEGRTVVVTGPLALAVPDDLKPTDQTDLGAAGQPIHRHHVPARDLVSSSVGTSTTSVNEANDWRDQ